jgi:hypothetical protein
MVPLYVVAESLSMTKKEKRLKKLGQNIRNVSLEEFETIINEYGHIEFGSRHPKAIIAGKVLAYKRKNPVSPWYVEELISMIQNL